MTHPLVPQVINIATPIAADLGLEVVTATFHTNQNPPVLRIDIRNLERDTALNDCEKMSKALEVALDATEIIPDAYILEVSSPGIPRTLETDREFSSFKGFPVIVQTNQPHQGKTEWQGQLVQRDEKTLYLTQKGRKISIPRSIIALVQLAGK